MSSPPVTVTSPSRKGKSKTFSLREKLNLDAHTITRITNERKKCGLIVSNCASLPLWLTDNELPSTHIITKREKPAIFEETPLQGTFTDGFAMYSTFLDVENCEVQFGINMTGKEFVKAIAGMFKKTETGTQDFFIYYSGVGKSFNGDWMAYDGSHDKLNIITLNTIVKKWLARPNQNKNQYLFIVSDTNYSGIWVSKARDRKLFKRHNILVQSSVSRNEPSLEMTIGEIKPPCWIMERTVGKFTHCWLEICASKFYDIKDCVVDMHGSFVVLHKKLVWDDNEEYYADTDHPSSNVEGPYDEKTIICIPCYGYEQQQEEEEELDGYADAAKEVFNDTEVEEELQRVLDDIKQQDAEEKEKEEQAKKKGVQFMSLNKDDGPKRGVKRRTSHLPQPSARRMNLLHGVIGGMKLKHAKKKSRHMSTYSRGFMFTKVLKDIRQLVMGSDDDEDEHDQQNKDWIDD